MKFFKFAYAVFFIAAIFYANLRVFAFLTPRHIVTVLMFIICIVMEKKVFLDTYFKLYLVFLFSFGISSLFTGYISPYAKALIGSYFVAYVGYWSTKLLIQKYNSQQFFVNLFVIVGLVNALVTIGQFLYIPIFQALPDLLHTRMDAGFVSAVESESDLYGLAIPGLIGDDVYNGYFLMVSVIISLYYQKDGFSFLKLIPWFVLFVALYFNQERGPFFLAVLVSILILGRCISINRNSITPIKKAVFYMILFGVGVWLVGFLSSGTSRFAKGLNVTNRDSIYSRAFEYISNHALFGGWYKFLDTEHFYPHNMLINAWISGGFLGFLVVLVMTVKQFVEVARSFLSKMNSKVFSNLVVGFAFVAFTMNSMLHNASIVAGDIVAWFLWGAFVIQPSRNREVRL